MLDTIMEFISDKLLDDLWAGLVEQELIKTAAPVAFLLAFCSELSTDEQATIANKSRQNLARRVTDGARYPQASI